MLFGHWLQSTFSPAQVNVHSSLSKLQPSVGAHFPKRSGTTCGNEILGSPNARSLQLGIDVNYPYLLVYSGVLAHHMVNPPIDDTQTLIMWLLVSPWSRKSLASLDVHPPNCGNIGSHSPGNCQFFMGHSQDVITINIINGYYIPLILIINNYYIDLMG